MKIAQTLIQDQERLLMIGKRACSGNAKPACGQHFCQSGQVLLSKDKWLDAPRGFEPRLTESESVVLPLDDGAMAGPRRDCCDISERAS